MNPATVTYEQYIHKALKLRDSPKKAISEPVKTGVRAAASRRYSTKRSTFVIILILLIAFGCAGKLKIDAAGDIKIQDPRFNGQSQPEKE